jgi:hypothetical protein
MRVEVPCFWIEFEVFKFYEVEFKISLVAFAPSPHKVRGRKTKAEDKK